MDTMKPMPKYLLLLLAMAAGMPDARELGGMTSSHWDDGRDGPGPVGGYMDTTRYQLEMEERAERFHGQLANRLNFLTSRLEAGKNPRAFEIADRIRGLLASAKSEIVANRPQNAFPFLTQAEVLCAELGRLSMDSQDMGRIPGQATHPDLYRNSHRPATSQTALMDAYALHKRLQDHLIRLRDRPGATSDEKARSLQARIQDLLDKSKESLAAGKTEAARELGLKAEALLTELHLAVAGETPGTGDPAHRRLEERLQRGTDLVRRRLSDGSNAERLAAASALIDQARAALRSGKAESAETLLKQAEKLLSENGAVAGGKLSAAAFDRLQAKLEKAGIIVKASGSEKAVRIMEKGLEHFGKAERYRSEGQGARAEAEMDISLKLAAKAVDIARAASR